MDGGTDRSSRFGSDTPYTKDVDANVNVNVADTRKPKCEHGNNINECLICWREDHGSSFSEE